MGANTCEMQGDGSWGGEGFSWNRDVAGNVGTIVSTIMAGVGAILP